MKTLILTTVICGLSTLGMNAQITLTTTDLPQTGDSQSFSTAEIPAGISTGNAGANQTWDFSALEAIDTFYTHWVDPAGTPGASYFPEADLCSLTGDVYSYLNLSSQALYFLGNSLDFTGQGDYIALIADPAGLAFKLPTTYGTQFSDETGFVVYLNNDSTRIVHREIKTVHFDGYGIVKTPLGAFNSLRERIVLVNFDTIQIWNLGSWLTVNTGQETEVNFNWFSKHSKGHLVSIHTSNGIVEDVSFQQLPPNQELPAAQFEYEDLGDGLIRFTDLSLNEPTAWLWDFDDGSTSDLQNPDHTYSTDGTYQVCLTATNDAGADTHCQDVLVSISGLTYRSVENQITISPNPANQYIQIYLEASGTTALVSIHDPFGRIVQTGILSPHQTASFDVTRLPKGIYLVVCKDAQGRLLARDKILIE